MLSSTYSKKVLTSPINSLPRIQEGNGCGDNLTKGCATETTPSSRMYCQTPTSKNLKTSDANKQLSLTPVSSRRRPMPRTPNPVPRNPFCTDAEVSMLQMQVWSPSVLSTVASPTKSHDCENFDWAIEEISRLKPAPIEEEPYQHLANNEDPDFATKINNVLEIFWKGQKQIAPSPWQVGKSVKPAKDLPTPSKDAASQTMLSLPPILPPDLEIALMPYLARDSGILVSPESMLGTSNEDDESFSSSLSQSGLRRKLSFMHEGSPFVNCPSSPVVSMSNAKGLLARTDKDTSVLRSPTISPIKSFSVSEDKRDTCSSQMSVDLNDFVSNRQSIQVNPMEVPEHRNFAYDDQTMDSIVAPGNPVFQWQSTDLGYLTETSSINFNHCLSRLPDSTLPSEPWPPHLGSSTPSNR